MNEPLPIACTLSPGDQLRRAADIRALGRDALVGVDRSPASATLRFRGDPATRVRVATIVAAESKCCAFLDFELSYLGDGLALTMRAPKGGEPAMHTLVDLFAAG